MAAPGISYDDVVQAAITITQADKNPTVSGIREQLGTGSATTISKHLRTWKAAGSPLEDIILPPALIDGLKTLVQKINQARETEIATLKKESEEAINHLKNELTALQIHLEEREAVIKALEKDKAALIKDYDKLSAKNSELNTIQNQQTVTLKTQAESIKTLKQSNKNTKAWYEQQQRKQDNILEQRSTELAQLTYKVTQDQGQIETLKQSIQKLNSENSDIQTKLDDKDAEYLKLDKSLTSANDIITELEHSRDSQNKVHLQSLQHLESLLATRESQLKEFKDRCEQLEKTVKQRHTDNINLRDQLNALNDQQAKLLTKINQLVEHSRYKEK